MANRHRGEVALELGRERVVLRLSLQALAEIEAILGTSSLLELIQRLSAALLGFLESLPIYPVFGRGWRRRVAETERAALRLAAALEPQIQQQTKENAMFELTKTFLASRTLWANVIGMLALVLSWLGFDTGTLDKGAVTDAIFQIIAGASFVASSIFRVIATKRLA